MKQLPGKPNCEGTEAESDHDDFEQELARLVAEQRRKRGWTQTQLAKKANLSVRTIRWVESGSAKRLRLSAGFRLFGLLDLRLRLVPIASTNPKEIARHKRLIQRGKRYLTTLAKRLPPRKLINLMGTVNEFEFLYEAARLVVEEGW